ncbi:molybdopterin cofactor-binding domain-containing protein [Sphingobacterium athyrii]|uniref:molybdopterin cofactor-binding domain-containing protein n=1 Tax=Sphingobacterium athyrii TaxID=2152717 RepID=UPI0028AAC51E|nr:molybdopterin cofactor-binding domain-containing protein [Sphingobacterium athyrii]
MRLTTVILFMSVMQVYAITTFGQRVTLNEKNSSLKSVLRKIRNQTGYDFIFDRKLMAGVGPVMINVTDVTLDEALKRLLNTQDLAYQMDGKLIVVTASPSKRLKATPIRQQEIDVRGKVLDQYGRPLQGATISVATITSTENEETGDFSMTAKGKKAATMTNANGEFSLRSIPSQAYISISYIGYQDYNAKAAIDLGTIKLKLAGTLDEVLVNTGYQSIIERTYTAPFLAHNTMEPVNCFAHVTSDSAILYGPLQAPEFTVGTLSQRLGLPKEKIQINLARMGGGFGRRAYGHHFIEAAAISKHLNAPVKLVYTREDEMTAGIYRPTYSATYRAALDKDNKLLALHVKAGGIPETPVHADRFPAGAVDNYLAEGWQIPSNITIGAFRAPRSNFIAAAEQSFLDELAMEMKKDPIDFRLELLERAKTDPVGKRNDYNADRYAEVLKLVREKSNWDKKAPGIHRGVSAYFCHNSYVAQVVDLVVKNNEPKVERVVAAIDCGIVVNRDAATNMAEGAIIDGIGNALYGELPFKDGVPQKNNFTTYRLIRMNEAPQQIEVHFVENEQDPTGLGEPPFPPTFGAVANALYQATGKRFYNQPFINQLTSV